MKWRISHATLDTCRRCIKCVSCFLQRLACYGVLYVGETWSSLYLATRIPSEHFIWNSRDRAIGWHGHATDATGFAFGHRIVLSRIPPTTNSGLFSHVAWLAVKFRPPTTYYTGKSFGRQIGLRWTQGLSVRLVSVQCNTFIVWFVNQKWQVTESWNLVKRLFFITQAHSFIVWNHHHYHHHSLLVQLTYRSRTQGSFKK